ncbi:PLP-dependent aminotransferase family protein [Comamonas sp. GB3 AK4-5]|uniref:aminotransferase-like domain-containing protein n=1 Tax=Comamonas sp. GB3 AK4-5 TaxID=3231487 RepID=UPI00351ECBE1
MHKQNTKENMQTSEPDWVVPLRTGNGPRYLQIVRMIENAVETGNLQPGDQIPTQRALAQRLEVDLTTVTRAYARAREQGLVSATTGRGSFIATQPLHAESSFTDLGMNVPPTPSWLHTSLNQGIEQLLRAQGMRNLSLYEPAALQAQLLQAGRQWLEPALPQLVQRQPLLLAAGTQTALCAILLSRCQRGEAVLCDSLTYPGFMLAARSLGLRLVPVAGDAQGMRPDALDEAQRASGARLLYLNPTLHNPSTLTMDARRRQEIAALLEQRQLTLIEDDPYRSLLPDAPPPLTEYTQGRRSFYLASLSKSVWPGLRCSFVLAPDQASADDVQDCLRATGMGASPLLAGLAAQWIASGQALRIAHEVQRESQLRQALARELLPKEAQAHSHGLHVWLPLPAHWPQQVFSHALQERGVGVATAQAFASAAHSPDAVRISLGAADSLAQLRPALEHIAALWNAGQARGSRRPVV